MNIIFSFFFSTEPDLDRESIQERLLQEVLLQSMEDNAPISRDNEEEKGSKGNGESKILLLLILLKYSLRFKSKICYAVRL